jgi:hypothetical protein
MFEILVSIKSALKNIGTKNILKIYTNYDGVRNAFQIWRPNMTPDNCLCWVLTLPNCQIMPNARCQLLALVNVRRPDEENFKRFFRAKCQLCQMPILPSNAKSAKWQLCQMSMTRCRLKSIVYWPPTH